MRVAGVQLDIAWEDPGTNRARAAGAIARAAEEGARLVALPEMFATGFSMNAARCLAAADETLAFLRDRARVHAVTIVAGIAVQHDGAPRNLAVVVGPDGVERARYAKIHAFSLADEGRHYAPGERLVDLALEDGPRIAPLVCYDLRFPESFRALAERVDLFVVIANWPARRGEAWRTLLRARAIENQAYVLGVNRVGADGHDVGHDGDSALIDPFGGTIASLGGRAGVVLGEVEADRVREARARFRFLADRRDDLYASWLDETR